MTGRKADVIKAAHLCAEAAIRLVKPGNQVRAELREEWWTSSGVQVAFALSFIAPALAYSIWCL